MSHSSKIADELFVALMDAPEKSLADLKKALENFRETNPRVFRRIMDQPFARAMIGAMTEAVDLAEDMARTSNDADAEDAADISDYRPSACERAILTA